jgi:O-antigen/teichoic acid export membrane protein
MNLLKINLLKSFSTFAFFNVLNAAIPFFLLPVLTKYLSPADYGIFTNIDVFGRFTLPFIVLGINAAINTAYFRMEKSNLPLYISSGVFLSLISTTILFALFFSFSSAIEKYLQIPIQWLMIIPIYCFLQGITQILLGILQVSKQSLRYGIYQVFMTTFNFSFSVFLIVHFKLNWSGRLLGIVTTYFIFASVAIVYLYRAKLLIFKISKNYIKDLLWFGVPLLPHLLAGPLIQFSDRFFITTYAGNSWTGIYNVAYQIGTSITLITVAFNQAWVPFLYEQLGNADIIKKTRLVKQSYLLMLAFIALAAILFIFTPLIFHWFIGPQFIQSKSFVFIISMGSVFCGFYFLVTNYIFYEKKTYILSWITISNGILSVLLNMFLVRKFGALGAAYTFLITNAFLFFSVWILSNKVYPMPWFYFLKKNKLNI